MGETAKRARVKITAISGGMEKLMLPSYGSEDAAGMDLYAAEDKVLKPGETYAMPLGFATEMPADVHARIEARSGLALKGVVVLTGVIDADYRGEWKAILHFLGPNEYNGQVERFSIAKGDRVAQAVLRSTVRAVLEPVETLQDSQRGAGGFGSTGQR